MRPAHKTRQSAPVKAGLFSSAFPAFAPRARPTATRADLLTTPVMSRFNRGRALQRLQCFGENHEHGVCFVIV